MNGGLFIVNKTYALLNQDFSSFRMEQLCLNPIKDPQLTFNLTVYRELVLL